jgi:cytochrome P450
MVMRTETPVYYEPFDPACRDGVFETYVRLHNEAPVLHTESGMWIVSRMDDVRIVHSRPDLFSARANGSEAMIPTVDPNNEALAERLAPVFDQMLLDSKELLTATVIVGADPPVHTLHRNSVNRAFTRRRIEALRGFVEDEVDKCLVGIDQAERYDVAESLASVLPLRVMERLFGLENTNSKNFKRWAYALAAQLNADEERGSVAQIGRHFDLLREFSDYFVPIMRERKENPGTDLISDIMSDEDDILNASEAVMFILTLMSAGVETTSNLIGNVIVSLMEHPDQLALVLDDPSRVPAAVEESLRYDSPFQFSFREAAQDVELSGVTIPKGGLIILLIGAANRDEKYFPDPGRFDLTRTSQHVGFGHGIHFCLGAALARMETQTAVARILPYLPDFRLDSDGVVDRPSLIMWGKEKIPLVRRPNTDS